VARSSVAVREATLDDASDLLAMWQDLRDLANPHDRSVPQPSEEGLLTRLAEARDNPDVRVLVAVIDDRLVGMAVVTHQPFASMFDCRAVQVNALHVRAGFRRRGAGRALISGAVAFAEERGADQIVTSVYPHLRETNRFYARLGFGPVLVRRSTSVASLRRKLAAAGAGACSDEVLLRRSSLRTRSRMRQALAAARGPLASSAMRPQAPPAAGR
jgi:GNAT superfamily N-acetyltransferase